MSDHIEPSTTEGTQGSQSTQSGRRKRSVSMMKSLDARTDLHVDFDDLCRPVGDNAAKFSSWVGFTTKSKISILEPQWNKIKKEELDKLWLIIKYKWNIDDNKYRSEVLKIANMAWKNFKKMLINKFVMQDRDPCAKYPYLDKEKWKSFIELKSTKEFKEKSAQGRENARLNKNPPRLGSRGYAGMKSRWDKEMESGESPELFAMKNERSRAYLLARRVRLPSGSYKIPDEIQPLADKIIEKDTQASQGDWVPKKGEDPLSAVIGREHPGRTRAVGHTVGLRRTILGFNDKKRKNNTREIEDIKQQFEEKQRKMEADFEEKQRKMEAHLEERQKHIEDQLVEMRALIQQVSKMDNQLDDIQKPIPCDLVFKCGALTLVFAKGRVHPKGNELCHSVPIKEDHVKVQVDRIMDGYHSTPLPVPTEELENLGQALNNFIQWPRDGVVFTFVQKEDEAHLKGESLTLKGKSTDESLPLNLISRPSELHRFYREFESNMNCRNGIELKIEDGVFGPNDATLKIYLDDLVCLLTNEWLDSSVIDWFQKVLHDILKQSPRTNRCGFISAASIAQIMLQFDFNAAIDYMATAMFHKPDMEFFLAPYLQGEHWCLLVICPHVRTVYVLDSMMSDEKTPDTYDIKNPLEKAINRYHNSGGPCETDPTRPFQWVFLKCNQQKSTWECGYYVILFMNAFALSVQFEFPKKNPWNHTTPFVAKELEQVARIWTRHFTLRHLKT